MSAGLLTSQFSTEAALDSAAIRYFTNSDYSHVDLVVPQAVSLAAMVNGAFKPSTTTLALIYANEAMLLGARFQGGVALRPPGYAKFTKTARVSCEVPNIDSGYAFAFDQLGKGYNSRALVDMFLHRSRPFSFDPSKWFCDELNYAIYWEAGVKLLSSDNPSTLTPGEEFLSPDFSPQKMAMAMVAHNAGVRLS